MKRITQLLIILTLAMFVAAVSGNGAAQAAQAAQEPSAPEKNTILIQDYTFNPGAITIRRGETITWINQDSESHTVTGKSFDSGLLGKGQAFKLIFNESGTFDYFCKPHLDMKGTVVVK